MAADAVIAQVDRVPEGRDEKHLEMARDMAAAFNDTYGERSQLIAGGGTRTQSAPMLGTS